MGDRLGSLRVETDDLHQRLHRTGPFAAIARGAPDIADVQLAIALHHRCWTAFVDRRSADQCRRFFAVSPSELFALPADAERISHGLRQAGPKPGTSHILGAAYVYVGSKKGGKLLSRRLRQAGMPDAAMVFAPRAADAARWASLVAAIERLGPDDFTAVVATAKWCFEQFDATASEADTGVRR